MSEKTVNILIVDDREENLIALEALLKRPEVNLILTTSPNQALSICWENEIAIALLDVQMPGMNGFELAELLKANPRTKDMIIIFATAISKETVHAVRGLKAGAIDYLYKPLDPYITSAKIDSLLKLVIAQRELAEKNAELSLYKKEMEKAKNSMIKQKENLSKINIHLEEIVNQRTKDLISKNQKLSEYSSHLSHNIRGPVATLKGLMILEKENLIDYDELIKQISHCVTDIDDQIININTELNNINLTKLAH